MKLLARVSGLEALAVRRREAVGLVWTRDEVRVDRAALRVGEHVAVDVRITGAMGEVELWTTLERVSREASDLGLVRDESGAVVGRVVGWDGSLIEWETAEAAAG